MIDRIQELRDALPDLEKPAGSALGLPAFAFYDRQWFEAERRHFFAREWMAVAFESDVAEVGDVFPVDIAGWPLLVTRARDGAVRVFRNICPHRGMRLLDQAKRECGAITCPWHAWTFDLTGRLAATPNIGGPDVRSQEGFDRKEHGLMALRSDSWMGVVFVNLDGKAAPLHQHIRPFVDRLSGYYFAATAQSDIGLDYHYDCNWKLAVEGGIEDYHIPFVHPQLGPSGEFFPEYGGDSYVGIMCKRDVAVGKRRFLNPEEAGAIKPLPMFPHVPDEGEIEASLILLLFPNLFMATVLDHSTMTIIVPEGPDKTRYRRRFRMIEPAATDPGYAPTRQKVLASWINVTEQDGPVWAEVQKLLPARDEAGFRPCFSVYWESAVHGFHRLIARKMLAAVDAAEEMQFGAAAE